MRNTDEDWIHLGEKEPYWGVITNSRFKTENISPNAIDDFYRSGVVDVETVVSRFRGLFADFKPGTALDFGCGVGRMTFPMAKYAGSVCGVDISPGMLSKAEERKNVLNVETVTFANEVPKQEYDWINSFLVFQHIPPKRGYSIVDELLSMVSASGFVSLEFSFARDAILKSARKLRIQNALFSLEGEIERNRRQPLGTMMMYEYDMNTLLKCLFDHRISEPLLVHTNHGGQHGCWIIGRK